MKALGALLACLLALCAPAQDVTVLQSSCHVGPLNGPVSLSVAQPPVQLGQTEEFVFRYSPAPHTIILCMSLPNAPVLGVAPPPLDMSVLFPEAPPGDCIMWSDDLIVASVVSTSLDAESHSFYLDIPNIPELAGFVIWAQAYTDCQCFAGFNFVPTNGLEITLRL